MANLHFARIGDVWKHGPLVEVLTGMRPDLYAETHAGSASYLVDGRQSIADADPASLLDRRKNAEALVVQLCHGTEHCGILRQFILRAGRHYATLRSFEDP